MQEALNTVKVDNIFERRPTQIPSHYSVDIVEDYLESISQYKRLTASEESVLGKHLFTARKASDILDRFADKNVDPLKTDLLENVVAYGARARQTLIESNLQLVVFRAKLFQGRNVDLIDMIQDGNMGLMRSLDTYDYRFGFRISTYAVEWIDQMIRRGIHDKNRTIRLPVKFHEKIGRLHKAEDELLQLLQRYPSVSEIAHHMQISPEEVQHIQENDYPVESLNKTAKGFEDDDYEEMDLVPDNSSLEEDVIESNFDFIANKEQAWIIFQIKNATQSILNERELVILRYYFGFEDDTSHTLEETAAYLVKIGYEHKITRERVRQLKTGAVETLRNAYRIKNATNNSIE